MSINIKTFVRGILISLIGTGALGILNYFVRRELALTLTITDFGFIYAALSLCNIFLAYLDVGIASSATILMSKSIASCDKEKTNKYYIQVFLLKIILSISVVLILASTYKFWVFDFFKYSSSAPFFILLLLIIVQAASSAPGAVITALKKYTASNIASVLVPITILIVILFNFKNNISIYAFAFPIGALIMMIFLYISSSKCGYYPKTNSVKKVFQLGELFHLSKWIAIATLGLTTMYYMDSLMLTWLDGLRAVGLYNVALPIMQIAQSLMVFSGVFLPIVAGMWVKDEKEEIGSICSMLTELTVYALWPIAFSIIILAKYIIIFLFSAKFTEAAPALIILFIGNIFFSLANFYMGVLTAGKHAKRVAVVILIGTCINIVLNYLLIPYMSINGAAASTAISYIFLTICLYLSLKKELPSFKVNINSILFPSIFGIILIIISSYFIFSSNTNNLKETAILFIITNLIYITCTYKTFLRYIKTGLNYISVEKT